MDFTQGNFLMILEMIGFDVTDFHTPGNGIILRHDVDGDLPRTMRAARIEYEMGIRSTIFILNTERYYKPKDPDFIRNMLTLQNEYGHEIGWHNNAIEDHYDNGVLIYDAIERPLNELRAMGLHVRCSSSHGGHICVEKRVANYNVFGYHCFRLPDYIGPTFRMDRFGLEVEAMHDKRDGHLSDGGRVWNLPPLETLYKWKKTASRYQLLIHPQWWDI